VSAAQSQVDLLTKQRRTITAQLQQLQSMFAAPGLFDGLDLSDDKSDKVKAAAAPTEKIGSEEELEELRKSVATKKPEDTSANTAEAGKQADKPGDKQDSKSADKPEGEQGDKPNLKLGSSSADKQATKPGNTSGTEKPGGNTPPNAPNSPDSKN